MENEDVLLLQALALTLPLLGWPALIVAELVVAGPVLHRRGPISERRRRAAAVLAILCLIAAAPLLLMVSSLGFLGALLLAGLAVPAILTLSRLRRTGRPPQQGTFPGV